MIKQPDLVRQLPLCPRTQVKSPSKKQGLHQPQGLKQSQRFQRGGADRLAAGGVLGGSLVQPPVGVHPGGEVEEEAEAEAGEEGGAVPNQSLRAVPSHALKTKKHPPVITAAGLWNLKRRLQRLAQTPPLPGGVQAGVGAGAGPEGGEEAGAVVVRPQASLQELCWYRLSQVVVGFSKQFAG